MRMKKAPDTQNPEPVHPPIHPPHPTPPRPARRPPTCFSPQLHPNSTHPESTGSFGRDRSAHPRPGIEPTSPPTHGERNQHRRSGGTDPPTHPSIHPVLCTPTQPTPPHPTQKAVRSFRRGRPTNSPSASHPSPTHYPMAVVALAVASGLSTRHGTIFAPSFTNNGTKHHMPTHYSNRREPAPTKYNHHRSHVRTYKHPPPSSRNSHSHHLFQSQHAT